VRSTLAGSEGAVSVEAWENPDAQRVVVIAHGYGEHIGRYGHVAAALVERGAAVYGPDHLGHGESEGERVLVTDFERVVDDLDAVIGMAQDGHPELPTVLVGHSMGGLIATRYAQRGERRRLAGLVLSGPAIGLAPAIEHIRTTPGAAEAPIDVATLSRDPAVGEAYAADPLVWHGAWKEATLDAFDRALAAVESGPPFDVPLLWIHGAADELVPIDLARPTVQRLAGDDFEEVVYPESRHEVLNELDKDEVIAVVAGFIERVA